MARRIHVRSTAEVAKAIALLIPDDLLRDLAIRLDGHVEPPFQDVWLESLEVEIMVRCPQVFADLERPLPEDGIPKEEQEEGD